MVNRLDAADRTSCGLLIPDAARETPLEAMIISVGTLVGDPQYGVYVIRRALEEPSRQIVQNGGAEGVVVMNADERRVHESGDAQW